MQRYPTSTSRAGAAIAAIALSALTLGLFVGMPATLVAPTAPPAEHAAATGAAAAAAEIAVSLGRIDVLATREPFVASAPEANVRPKGRRGG